MKAVVYPRPKEFKLMQVDDPPLRPGHIRVKVMATTICATDMKVFEGNWPNLVFPHVAGHEWAGEVVEVGEGVVGLRPGDRVGIEVHCGCGACARCIEGLYNLCEHYGNRDVGHAHVGFTTWGGFAEYAVVPAKVAHRLPDEMDWDTAAFTDNIGIALWAVERAGVMAGDTVVVVGPGCFGLLAVQVARALGAGKVILAGTRPDRLQLGTELGADATVNVREKNPVAAVRDMTGGKGADVVVEFAGSEAAATQALQMARRGGRVVLAGATAPGRELRVDLSTIVRGHLNVYGSVGNPRWVSKRGLELIRTGAVSISPLITHRLSLDEFARAWELTHVHKDESIRVIMYPHG